MSDLQIFNNPEFGEIRTIAENNKVLFCAKDVAEALGYKRPADAVTVHCKGSVIRRLPTNGGEQGMKFIPIGDVFRLAAKSELPGAERFESWIFDEVLPSIHENGAYIAHGTSPQGVEAAALQAALQPISATMEALTAAVQTLTRRMDSVEQGGGMRALPPPLERNPFDDNPFDDQPKPSSLLARKMWMRLVNEKLELLSQRYGKSNNAILHKIYQDMEERFETVLDEERNRVMEEQRLDKCSVLLAIFFDPELRDYFQRYVDYNLAPENRGW